jgi:hypothetical protein
MKYVSDEQRDRVMDLRRARRLAQPKHRCKKHPTAPSRLFMVAQPERKTKALWLCVECAAVLVEWHGATLTGAKT